MSTRAFWVIFTLSIIILVQLFFVGSATQWVVTQEILNRGITVGAAFPDKDVSDVELERPLSASDLSKESFSSSWKILYRVDPGKAIRLTGSLIILGILAGFLVASLTFRYLIKFVDKLSQLTTTDKISAFIGGTLGILISAVFVPLVLGEKRNPTTAGALGIVITGVCIRAALGMKEELKFYWPSLAKGDVDKAFQKPKILDTNVIIDGRIADICAAGFIEGQILIPSFVLEELQHIADSADSLRRARGRRGLDILNQMRKELNLVVRQSDPVNPANPEEVDVRLVKLAQEIDGTIVTNDFNLNKVAEVQGLHVLNINELANALKPVVLPGEELTVLIIKEGKEMNQGIAYLDDGTMIVIEGAKRHIGETQDVIVTSVLQTVAGKMIFANLKTLQEEEDRIIDRNVRDYSGFRPRKKT